MKWNKADLYFLSIISLYSFLPLTVEYSLLPLELNAGDKNNCQFFGYPEMQNGSSGKLTSHWSLNNTELDKTRLQCTLNKKSQDFNSNAKCQDMLQSKMLCATSSGVIAYVNPFVGTGGHGHTFPGAAYPFGMMQLSPDTRLEGWDGCSGYHYTDTLIYGFSHTHLSGTGVPDYCDVLFMPGMGPYSFHNGSNGKNGYSSQFQKKTEKATPGYYEVFLEKYKVLVKLTVGKRTGIHHYRFSQASGQWLIIDLKHRDPLIKAEFTNMTSTSIAGFRTSSSWARNQHLSFKAIFNKKVKSHKYSDDSLKVILFFENNGSIDLYAQVGISAVDEDGAALNLRDEFNDFNFNKLWKKTQREWNLLLGRIEIEDENINNKKIFYTALYHTLIHPSLFQDADRRYRGMDLKIHMTTRDDHFTVFSLWDTYRSTHPLYQWIYPEYNSKFIRTFLRQYKECGHLPVWELAGNETWCMIGNHAIPVIANAFHHKVTDFDTLLAKEAIEKTLLNGTNSGIKFMNKGFILSDEESESVSKTIENSVDFGAALSISSVKIAPFHPHMYWNLYNPETGFFQAKRNQIFVKPFDPKEVNFHFTEANAYQYLFGAHHDIEGLKYLFSLNKSEYTKENFKSNLDSMFLSTSEMTGREQSDITGLIGQYAHGNEPSHHIAYLYSAIGYPFETLKLVEKIKSEFYKNDPDGLIGNEDCGQMSSWYVFSALGFYPLHPYNAEYVLGSPSFKSVRIKVPGQKEIRITADDLQQGTPISHFTMNGLMAPLSFKIKPGDHLNFSFSDKKTQQLFNDNRISPDGYHAMPYIKSGDQVFYDSTLVTLASLQKDPIEYTTDTTNGVIHIYEDPILLKENAVIFFRNHFGNKVSEWLKAKFFRKTTGIILKLETDYENQYAASGKDALVDGLIGSYDFRDGLWQGFQGRDLNLTLEFPVIRTVRSVDIRFLQDQRSWILMPTEVEFLISEDGRHFETIEIVKNNISKNETNSVIENFKLDQNMRCRMIKIIAKNPGPMPEDHPGAGGQSWLFSDEIIIN